MTKKFHAATRPRPLVMRSRPTLRRLLNVFMRLLSATTRPLTTSVIWLAAVITTVPAAVIATVTAAIPAAAPAAVTVATAATTAETATAARPHMDLEMTSYEYRALLKKYSQRGALFSERGKRKAKDAEDIALDRYIQMGERNLQWVDLVNQSRTPETKISLSSEATTGGNSVSNPKYLNFAVVKENWEVLEVLLPEPLKQVIFDGAPLTRTLPVSEREFIEWLLQVDKAYQNAARYKMLKPWKKEYAKEAALDVRGYLTLVNDPQVDKKLRDWSKLTAPVRHTLTTALIGICRNAGLTMDDCETKLDAAVAAKQLKVFKDKFIPAGEANYRGFFDIPVTRKDVAWTAANPDLMRVPFADPKNQAIKDFLKFNIEDEYQWNGWRLALEFINTKSPDTTHVVFEPGTTPHVNKLAGSIITMDANAPLTEYDVQWTIRHEYGHVLGFPDCYIEFYDEGVEAFVSYQLDVTNLMCSRRGRLQQRHYDELKRVYFK